MEIFAEHGWIGWIVVGALAGGLAKLLMPGKDGGNIFMTIILGIAGAALSGYLGTMLGWYGPGDGVGFIGAVVGAFVLLLIYRQIKKRQGAA